MPLVEARTTSDELTSEAGVSYLIEAGETRLLFDLGLNAQKESPSPLQRNAAALDVDLDTVDAVVLSHGHQDHVGGLRAQMADSFVLPSDHWSSGVSLCMCLRHSSTLQPSYIWLAKVSC